MVPAATQRQLPGPMSHPLQPSPAIRPVPGARTAQPVTNRGLTCRASRLSKPGKCSRNGSSKRPRDPRKDRVSSISPSSRCGRCLRNGQPSTGPSASARPAGAADASGTANAAAGSTASARPADAACASTTAHAARAAAARTVTGAWAAESTSRGTSRTPVRVSCRKAFGPGQVVRWVGRQAHRRLKSYAFERFLTSIRVR